MGKAIVNSLPFDTFLSTPNNMWHTLLTLIFRVKKMVCIEIWTFEKDDAGCMYLIINGVIYKIYFSQMELYQNFML